MRHFGRTKDDAAAVLRALFCPQCETLDHTQAFPYFAYEI
ncbi:hypothetical protein CEV32_2205 [Brucella rhizosphaerae]|uniref:Uncharacterized protein n=1 Tax=Brucella rhizosphaerae TaxID=571254 RepID=A0A256F4K6_9HYPH|nr:hypothetical protein CEV32_2205 [Brucella rhizosphaerae]